MLHFSIVSNLWNFIKLVLKTNKQVNNYFRSKSQVEIKSQNVYEKPDFKNSPNQIYQGLEIK